MLANNLKYNRYVLFRLCRRFCDKKIETESSSGDSQDEKLLKKQAASKKLASLLEQLNVESQSQTEGKTYSFVLNLAKPNIKDRRPRKKRTKEVSEKDIIEEKQAKQKAEAENIEPDLISAVQSVANDLGGDTQRTTAELLQKLRSHSQEITVIKAGGKIIGSNLKSVFAGMKVLSSSEEDKKLSNMDSDPSRLTEERIVVEETAATDDTAAVAIGVEAKKEESELLQRMRAHMKGENVFEATANGKYGSKMSRLFTGIKIDRSKKPASRQPIKDQPFVEDWPSDVGRDMPNRTFGQQPPRGIRSPYPTPEGPINLFGSEPLNWFKTKKEVEAKADYPVLETWDALQKHHLELMVSHPFTNAYQEMIAWTDQGKLWKFPIDNEQGLEEEAKIGFEQHIFFESYLQGFPEKGPIRHFMELVTVGLSKNPYITVQRKIEHIEWFRQYFKEKETILRETGAIMEAIT